MLLVSIDSKIGPEYPSDGVIRSVDPRKVCAVSTDQERIFIHTEEDFIPLKEGTDLEELLSSLYQGGKGVKFFKLSSVHGFPGKLCINTNCIRGAYGSERETTLETTLFNAGNYEYDPKHTGLLTTERAVRYLTINASYKDTKQELREISQSFIPIMAISRRQVELGEILLNANSKIEIKVHENEGQQGTAVWFEGSDINSVFFCQATPTKLTEIINQARSAQDSAPELHREQANSGPTIH